MWITVDDNNRIIGTTEGDMSTVYGWFEVDVDIPVNFTDYKIIDNNLTFDPMPTEIHDPTTEERVAALEAAVLEIILKGDKL